ncbi:MAG: molybdenum cofactor guanylyltransferase [Syntrophorhabdaceae bacterium]|nr:molybdenum cofactor guanylyltransferase [Syntrophorhabdaceae bacterium]
MLKLYYMDFTCAILAGGYSKRLGFDKTFLKIGGTPLINIVYREVKKVFEKIVIISSRHTFIDGIDAPILTDIMPISGSIVGLVSALMYAETPYVFVIASDMPFLSRKQIEYVLGEAGKYDVVVPKTKMGYEPLHALYNRSCISPLFKLIDKGNLQIISAFPYFTMKVLDEEWRFYNNGVSVFTNINVVQDLSVIASHGIPMEQKEVERI